jgi:molecular chaperone DnaK (HSP70)
MLRFNLSGGKMFEELLTRTEFEKWIQPIVARTMGPCENGPC